MNDMLGIAKARMREIRETIHTDTDNSTSQRKHQRLFRGRRVQEDETTVQEIQESETHNEYAAEEIITESQ